MPRPCFHSRVWIVSLALAAVWAAPRGASAQYPTRPSAEQTRASGTNQTSTGAAPSSDATPPSDVERLNEEGSRLFQAGDYRRASERFIEAYAISHDPNLMFNVARCYEELGEYGLAIEKYESFLAAKDLDEEGASRARAALERLKQQKAEARATTPPGNGAAPATPAPANSSTGSPNFQESVTARPTTSGGVSPVFPWLTLGLGIVSAGVGAAFYTMGASDHDKVTGAEGFNDPKSVSTMTEREAQDLSDSGKSKKTLGVVGLGVGGVLMATSVVLFLNTSSSSRAATAGRFSLPNRPRYAGGAADAVKVSVASANRGATISVQGVF